MRKLHHPSPSMIVALIALMIALGGSAFAATSGSINGSRLTDRSVAGTKLVKNTLGGTEINEKTLGQVPAAKNASTLAHLPATAFVQGGGETFAHSIAIAKNTSEAPAFDIPQIGKVSLGCDGSGQIISNLANGTGQPALVKTTFVGDSSTFNNGYTAGPGSGVLSNLNGATGSVHVLMVWPVPTPTHSADFTVGWYLDSFSNKCTMLAGGIVR